MVYQLKMKNRVPLFGQMSDFTCGSCATLMVWKYFDRKVQLSKRNEFLIWTEIAALPFKFSSPYRIAEFFIKRGFETKLVMKQEEVSEDITLLECCQADPTERKLFVNFFKAYNRILRRRLKSTIIDKKPTLNDIRKALSNRSLVIVLIDSYHTAKDRGAHDPPHLPHWVVITGGENKKFHINDSAQECGLSSGKIIMEGPILSKAMNTYSRFGWSSALISIH